MYLEMCFGEALSQEVRRMRSGEFGEGWGDAALWSFDGGGE